MMQKRCALISIILLLFVQFFAVAHAQDVPDTLFIEQIDTAAPTASPGPREPAQPEAAGGPADEPVDEPEETGLPGPTEVPGAGETPDGAELPGPSAEPAPSPEAPEAAESSAADPTFVVTIPQEVDFGVLTPGEGVVQTSFSISARDVSGLGEHQIQVTVRSSNRFHLVAGSGAGEAVPYRLLGQTEAVEQGGVVAVFTADATVDCLLELDCSLLAEGEDYQDTLKFDVRLLDGLPADTDQAMGGSTYAR